MFELREQGKDYWAIVTRYNRFKDQALMRKVARKDMVELLGTTTSQVMRNRITNWLARNQPATSPSNGGGKGGPPRYA
jgi:hypothetical protein